ncbi:hypothetical protein C8Q80DRAFT_1249886 [Daedaleopsis nitida]|nr:hypothetical protein C8Q80DRAFT_1249886 [Daedaleopsis nitida]
MNPPAVYQAYMVIPMDHPRIASRRRFWHLLACAFLSFVALHLLLWGNRSHLKRTLGRTTYAKDGLSQCWDPVNWTSTTDLSGESPYRARTTLTLPLSAKELLFTADGALQYGDFEVSQDVDVLSENVFVDIDVAFQHPDALSEATVCRTHANEGTWGLGIFTPHWTAPHLDRSLRFHIHLRLPTATLREPLKVNSLSTRLPQFSHRLPELIDSVHFDSIKLKSQNAPIIVDVGVNATSESAAPCSRLLVQSLAGDRIWLNTRNGLIAGRFTASSLLDVSTANAPISVSAALLNAGESTTNLFLKTTNGRIDAQVSLTSNTSESGGTFHVVARSSNAPLTLTFVDAPADSTLSMTASTSNAPAHVTVHKTFEGSFDLASSSGFRPEVEWAPVGDPAGHNRTRRVVLDMARKASGKRGTVSWEETGKAKGRVVVETTNAPLRLVL